MKTFAKTIALLLLATPALAADPPKGSAAKPNDPMAAPPPSAAPPPASPSAGSAPVGGPLDAPPPASPAPAPAATDNVVKAAPEPTKSDRGAFIIGLKAGGLFAEPFTNGHLGPSFLVDVEVGYNLPFAKRAFAVLLDGGYTQPTASGGCADGSTTNCINDPRIDANSGSYQWSLTQRELMFGLTVMFRATFIGEGKLVPYLGVGPRLWLLQTVVSGQAGANNPITQSQEQSTTVGLHVPLGVDYLLGPGRVFIEAQLLWAPIQHRTTGDSSVGSITAELGYRLFL